MRSSFVGLLVSRSNNMHEKRKGEISIELFLFSGDNLGRVALFGVARKLSRCNYFTDAGVYFALCFVAGPFAATQAERMSKPKVHYFPIPGRGEFISLILEEVHYSFSFESNAGSCAFFSPPSPARLINCEILIHTAGSGALRIR